MSLLNHIQVLKPYRILQIDGSQLWGDSLDAGNPIAESPQALWSPAMVTQGHPYPFLRKQRIEQPSKPGQERCRMDLTIFLVLPDRL